ncbi:MAG: hypothetical protein QOH63_1476 [Acidobacteriota bacterium]|jgi:hypothetical protein|nr:hypothetical protein [Acidobacteriota bacterium]
MKSRFVIALAALIFATTFSLEAFGQKTKKVKDKRFEAVIRQNLKDYEGTYIGIEPTYVIEIRVMADGKLSVSSLENNRKVVLENIKIEGAHLTATKSYQDGSRANFDATFSNRILNGASVFGILVDGMRINVDGVSLTRVFYQRKRD